MTFSRVNIAGWALYETLSSAQMNALDINVSNALDGAAGGSYSPSDSLLVAERLGGMPLQATPQTGSPADVEDGDIWYDDTAADRLKAYIDGAEVLLVVTPAASLSRVVYVSMADGQPTFGETATEPVWFYNASLNAWSTPNHDGVSRYMCFSLNGMVPQDATLTEVAVYINSGGGLGSTTGVLVQLCGNTDGVENIIDSDYDSGAGAQWVTLGGLSEVFVSDTKDYFVRVRSATNTDSTDDDILAIKLTFTLAAQTTIP